MQSYIVFFTYAQLSTGRSLLPISISLLCREISHVPSFKSDICFHKFNAVA